MRKYVLMIAVMFFIFGSCVTVHAAVDKTFEVVVLSVIGDVQVDAKGDGNWTKAVPGMKLVTGAKLKTAAASSAKIVYDAAGLNVIEIKENTIAVVKASSLDLVQGSVLAKFDNLEKGSSFSVKTPTAVCAIRGSGMGVDYINNMTVVMAFEHNVFVTGLDASGNLVSAEVTIPEGWSSSIDQNGNLTPPAELTENELAIWNAWVAVVAPTGGDDLQQQEDQAQNDLDPGDIDETKKDDEEGNEEENVISPSGSGSTSYSYSIGY